MSASMPLPARTRVLLLAGLGPALYIAVLLLDSLTRPATDVRVSAPAFGAWVKAGAGGAPGPRVF